MWTFVLNFLKSKILSVVLIAALAIGVWYHFYKVNDLEEDIVIGQNTIAILANEYEQSVATAKHNAVMVVKQNEDFVATLEVIRSKYEFDIERLYEANRILERTKYVDEKDDGNVSNVMRDTLDAIRMLHEKPRI